MNKLELIDKKLSLRTQCEELINNAEKETRKLNSVEDQKFAELKKQMADIDEEIRKYDEKLEMEKKASDAELENRKNNIQKNTMKSIVSEIRSAMDNGTYKFTLETENRAQTVKGVTVGEGEDATHVDTTVIETEVKPILEPLYEKSILNEVGATIYHGLPMGEISVPVMGSDNSATGWADEVAKAGEHKNTFTNVTLRPKRLVATIDISKTLLAMDTVGVNEAIKRDIVNALQNKFEKTIFGNDAKTDLRPAGLFNGKNFTTVASYADICNLESDLEDTGISGEMKYLASTKFKAFARQLAKSTKSTQLVYENGALDGTDLISTSLVPTKTFAYGNFADFIIGLWGNLDVVLDPYTQAANNCVRLTVTMYADATLARENALKFGNIA